MIRRKNFLLGLVLLLVATITLLRTLTILPLGVYDLLLRAAPALLLLAGLVLLLRLRVRFAGVAALIATLGFVAAVAALAFSTRSAQPREDQRIAIDQPLETAITTLQINVETLATDVEIVNVLGDARSVTGEFVGSKQSTLDISYEVAGAIATLTILERQPSGFPDLEAVGRGRLRMELPAQIAIGLAFLGDNGAAAFNLNGLNVERLNINLLNGDAVVTLPDYRPLLQTDSAPMGELAVRAGNLTLFVPATIAGRFELNRGGGAPRPEFDPNIYNFIEDRILEARGVADVADIDIRYVLTVPRGLIRLQVGT